MNNQKIRKLVNKAFPLVPVPKCRLIDAVTSDSWGHPPQDWPVESWTNWSEIPDTLLDQAELLLTYFKGDELVYFIPRFVIKFIDEGAETGRKFSHATRSLIHHVSEWRQQDYNGIPLTSDQKSILDWVYQSAQDNQVLRLYVD
jgi:hypothetical protein